MFVFCSYRVTMLSSYVLYSYFFTFKIAQKLENYPLVTLFIQEQTIVIEYFLINH